MSWRRRSCGLTPACTSAKVATPSSTSPSVAQLVARAIRATVASSAAAMATLTELDVPTLDYRDPGLTGPAFRGTLKDLRERSWIARAEPIGWFVLDHEATAFFLRTRSATFPGRIVLEVQ